MPSAIFRLHVLRLHLAVRLHLALLRETGEGVNVLRVLRDGAYARRTLDKCHDSADYALCTLADTFGDLTALDDARRELARAAVSARAALAHLALGAEGAVIVRRPRSQARPREAAFG